MSEAIVKADRDEPYCKPPVSTATDNSDSQQTGAGESPICWHQTTVRDKPGATAIQPPIAEGETHAGATETESSAAGDDSWHDIDAQGMRRRLRLFLTCRLEI